MTLAGGRSELFITTSILNASEHAATHDFLRPGGVLHFVVLCGGIPESMGHKRAYFGGRIVSRALGKPGNAAAFEQLSATLAKEHAPVQARLLEAERRWRILAFAQPPVSDDLLAAEWSRTSAALGAFFLTQADHQERLARAGYDLDDPAVRARVAARPASELATLAENVRKKLAAGSGFHAELIATMENAETPKRK